MPNVINISGALIASETRLYPVEILCGQQSSQNEGEKWGGQEKEEKKEWNDFSVLKRILAQFVKSFHLVQVYKSSPIWSDLA